MRRRKADSLEVQQMKAQAREEKARKQVSKTSGYVSFIWFVYICICALDFVGQRSNLGIIPQEHLSTLSFEAKSLSGQGLTDKAKPESPRALAVSTFLVCYYHA